MVVFFLSPGCATNLFLSGSCLVYLFCCYRIRQGHSVWRVMMKSATSILGIALMLAAWGCRRSGPSPIQNAPPEPLLPASEAGGKGRTIDILVMGDHGERKLYHFQPDEPCTLKCLLLRMGGLPRYTRYLCIYRLSHHDGRVALIVNALELMASEDSTRDFQLEHGDRVEIWLLLWAT